MLGIGCDEGLAPPEEELPTGIEGTVYFTGEWPPEDSVKEIRVVAFQYFVTGDSSAFIREVLGGRAFFSDTLRTYQDSSQYRILLKPPYPDSLRFVVVALRYGENFFTDWRVVGLYGTFSDSLFPRSVPVLPGVVIRPIDIFVDFHHLPPQPFE